MDQRRRCTYQDYNLPHCYYGPSACSPNNVVGSSQLLNATMETYDQGCSTQMVSTQFCQPNPPQIPAFSCFDCHGGGGDLSMGNLSHIFKFLSGVTRPPQ